MEANAYRHTARVNERAWFLRLYLWMWDAEMLNVDFCRLFWGYVFAPLNLLVRVVGFPLYLLFRFVLRPGYEKLEAMDKQHKNEPVPTTTEKRLRRAEKKAVRAARLERLLGFVSRAADRVVGFVQRTWPIARFPVYIAGALGAIAVGATAAYFGYKLVALLIAVIPWIGVAQAVVGLIVAVLLGALAVALIVRHEDELGAFGSALKTGAIGVKSRTCPRIEIVKKESH